MFSTQLDKCIPICPIPFPLDKMVALYKLKAIADSNLNVVHDISIQREENIVGKGENAGYHHFLLSQKSFLKSFSMVSLKVGIV